MGDTETNKGEPASKLVPSAFAILILLLSGAIFVNDPEVEKLPGILTGLLAFITIFLPRLALKIQYSLIAMAVFLTLGGWGYATFKEGSNTDPVVSTTIIQYYPDEFSEETQEVGICDPSNMLSRKDALRCFVGNNIYDPCFAVLDPIFGLVEDPIVVCNTGPYDETNSISISVTYPIISAEEVDAQEKTNREIIPWIFELEEGLICAPASPMYAPKDAENSYPYFCGKENQDEVWAGSLTAGDIWKASIVRRTENRGGLRDFKIVNIRKIWY